MDTFIFMASLQSNLLLRKTQKGRNALILTVNSPEGNAGVPSLAVKHEPTGLEKMEK